MKKLITGLVLTLTAQASLAACPPLDGNWLLQTSLTAGGLSKNKLLFDAGQVFISISGSNVSISTGFLTSITQSANVSLSSVDSGTGTVSIDPNTCRITFNVQSQNTTFNGNGQQSATTSTFSGKADYVKVFKGFAGKGRFVRGKKTLASTFNLVR